MNRKNRLTHPSDLMVVAAFFLCACVTFFIADYNRFKSYEKSKQHIEKTVQNPKKEQQRFKHILH